MAIFLKYDGIEGTSRNGGNGGVWKTTNFLTRESTEAVNLSSIALRDSPLGFDLIDARDANAAGKARMLFETASGLGMPGSAVLSVSKFNKFSSLNKLYQLGKNAGIDPKGRLLVGTDQGTWSNVMEIRLFGATFSNLSANNDGGETVFSLALTFAKAECRKIQKAAK